MPGRAADRDPQRRARARRVRSATPWAASVGVHAAVVILGLFVGWIVVSPREEPPDLATVSFFDPGPPPPAPVADGPQASIADLAAQDAPAPPIVFDEAPMPTLDDLLAPAPPPEVRLPSVALPRPTPEGAMAAVPDVTIYGMGVSDARRLVYIVDGSGSMVATLPLVVAELKRSIDRLAPTQEFQVYFFRAGDYVAFEPTGEDPEVKRSKLYPATNANKRAAGAWLDAYRPAGPSNPLYAIEVALSHPDLDAIFLLSTGLKDFAASEGAREAFMASLDGLNPARGPSGRRVVAIKVVHFFDRDPSGLLEAIGREHGGAGGYAFRSRKEVGR